MIEKELIKIKIKDIRNLYPELRNYIEKYSGNYDRVTLSEIGKLYPNNKDKLVLPSEVYFNWLLIIHIPNRGSFDKDLSEYIKCCISNIKNILKSKNALYENIKLESCKGTWGGDDVQFNIKLSINFNGYIKRYYITFHETIETDIFVIETENSIREYYKLPLQIILYDLICTEFSSIDFASIYFNDN